jgi:hypothetical protein
VLSPLAGKVKNIEIVELDPRSEFFVDTLIKAFKSAGLPIAKIFRGGTVSDGIVLDGTSDEVLKTLGVLLTAHLGYQVMPHSSPTSDGLVQIVIGRKPRKG